MSIPSKMIRAKRIWSFLKFKEEIALKREDARVMNIVICDVSNDKEQLIILSLE
jgi:hypothetical protein